MFPESTQKQTLGADVCCLLYCVILFEVDARMSSCVIPLCLCVLVFVLLSGPKASVLTCFGALVSFK